MRIERTHFTDGSTEWECEYDGDVPHGTWRQWYANGRLALEEHYQHGRHVDCTNRVWYENGQLCSETVYVGGRKRSFRLWDQSGKALPSPEQSFKRLLKRASSKAERTTAAKRRRTTTPEESEAHASFIAAKLSGRAEPAESWLRSSTDQACRSIGELEPSESLELVGVFLRYGAVQVSAVGVENLPGTDHQTTNLIVVHLPGDPIARARLFSIQGVFARDMGFQGDSDFGQDHLILHLS